MIQDTTPYSAYAALMGGGPGAAANMGVGVGAGTGAMAQTLSDRGTQNQGLNVQSQDIANQAAQEALKQAQIQTPVQGAQAEQKIQEAQQQTAAGAQYGPEMLASMAQANIAKNYTGKTLEERTKHESQMKDWVDASNLVSDPHFDWGNKDHVSMLKNELSKGGMEDVPDNLTKDNIPQIQAGAQMAVKSLALTQQMKLQTQKGEQEMSIEQMKKQYDLQIAQANREATFGQAMWAKPEDERAKARLEMAFDKQGQAFTSSQKSEAEGLIAKSLATDPDTARIHETAVREWNSLRNFSVDKIKADADVKVPDSIKGQDQAASYVADAHEKQARDKLIDKRFNEKFPGAKVINDGGVSAPTRIEAMQSATTSRAGQGTPQAPTDTTQERPPGVPANYVRKTVNGVSGWGKP
jgi:hypothetical protein